MGLSVAGLAFRPNLSTLGEPELVQTVFGSTRFAPPETQNAHDTRVPGNVSVESKNSATFLYNSDVADRILFEGYRLQRSVFEALGEPEIVVVFCHYDSGNSFGYAILKDGITVRSRVHVMDKTTDAGAPNNFELPWLQAEPFIEEEGEPPAYRNLDTGEVTSRSYVTAHLLTQVMKGVFGFCPWDEWDYRTRLNFYSREPSAT